MTLKDVLPTILELGFDPQFLPSLEGYLKDVWSANERLNLMSRKMSYEEFLKNHLIDCLLPLKYFPKSISAVADFGSGGGLPGILYAIQFPKMKFHLFEKSPKKQEFLLSCKKWAPNIEVHGEINSSDLNKVELITARAFKALDIILELSRDYYLRGGSYFLLKGRQEKIQEEYLLAQKKFKNLKLDSIPLQSPVLEVERHLVRINCKIDNT